MGGYHHFSHSIHRVCVTKQYVTTHRPRATGLGLNPGGLPAALTPALCTLASLWRAKHWGLEYLHYSRWLSKSHFQAFLWFHNLAHITHVGPRSAAAETCTSEGSGFHLLLWAGFINYSFSLCPCLSHFQLHSLLAFSAVCKHTQASNMLKEDTLPCLSLSNTVCNQILAHLAC